MTLCLMEVEMNYLARKRSVELGVDRKGKEMMMAGDGKASDEGKISV